MSIKTIQEVVSLSFFEFHFNQKTKTKKQKTNTNAKKPEAKIMIMMMIIKSMKIVLYAIMVVIIAETHHSMLVKFGNIPGKHVTFRNQQEYENK